MVQANTIDAGLGTKPVPRLALTMSVPTIVAQAANASYTIIDRLFIGHIPEVGNAAMTGVGICFPILLAVTAFASLIGAGGAPRASIELGRGNFKKAERILGTSAAFLIAIALTLTVLLQLAKRPILYAFGASDATIEYAVDFITIYLIGTVFVQLTLGLNNFISAQGKTTVAMVSVLIGTGISILFDPVFIFVFGWGVRGAAAANVLAQLVSTIWIVLFLSSGRSAIRLRPLNIRFDRIIIPVLALGLAPFIMQITECLINVVFNVGLQRYGGDDYVTSITIITSLMQIVSVLTSGFQQGIQPIIGFNFGARHMERVRQAVPHGLRHADRLRHGAGVGTRHIPRLFRLMVHLGTDCHRHRDPHDADFRLRLGYLRHPDGRAMRTRRHGPGQTVGVLGHLPQDHPARAARAAAAALDRRQRHLHRRTHLRRHLRHRGRLPVLCHLPQDSARYGLDS